MEIILSNNDQVVVAAGFYSNQLLFIFSVTLFHRLICDFFPVTLFPITGHISWSEGCFIFHFASLHLETEIHT